MLAIFKNENNDFMFFKLEVSVQFKMYCYIALSKIKQLFYSYSVVFYKVNNRDHRHTEKKMLLGSKNCSSVLLCCITILILNFCLWRSKIFLYYTQTPGPTEALLCFRFFFFRIYCHLPYCDRTFIICLKSSSKINILTVITKCTEI